MADASDMVAGGAGRSGNDRNGGWVSRQFRLAERLSEDEWGAYWTGTDGDGERTFSVLELRPDLRRSRRVMAELSAGIRRLEGRRHPKLAGIRQIVTVGSGVYATGDPAEGVPLGDWLGGGTRAWTDLEPLARELADTLDWAHRHGLVHGHLQPADILVDADGRLGALLGFGANSSRLRLGAAPGGGGAGWVAYRAPETAGEHGEADDAGDQYALAAVLWRALCGAAPGEGCAADAPESAETALRRALSPKPRHRFVSCGDLVRAMAGEEVGGKRGAGASERRRSRARWMRTGIAAGAVALAAALAAGGAVAWELAQKSREGRLADAAAAARTADAPPQPGAELRETGNARPLRGTPAVAEEGRDWATPDGMEYLWIGDLECWVGRFEVCNADFRRMDPEHDSGYYKGLPLDDDRQPAVRLNFDEMMDFADWLTDRERGAGRIPEGWRFRLPTRGESVACAEAGVPKTYPWGGSFPPPNGAGNYADAEFHDQVPGEPWIEGYRDGYAASAPVDKAGQNAWGLFGMGGNVWETTALDETADRFGGWHGGAFDDARAEKTTCKSFYGYMGTARGAVNGFRLVLAPDGEEESGEPGDG